MENTDKARDQECLEFFAELASLKGIEDAGKDAKKQLRSEFKRLFPHFAERKLDAHERQKFGYKENRRLGPAAIARRRLDELHTLCSLIASAVNGEWIDLHDPMHGPGKRLYGLDRETRRLRVRLKREYLPGDYRGDFFRLVSPDTSFSFERCPICTDIFVMSRPNQKCCSEGCQRTGVEERRKGKRKKYFRELRRKQRAAKKAASSTDKK